MSDSPHVTVTVDLADLYMALAWADVGIHDRRREGQSASVDFDGAQKRVNACRDAMDAAAVAAGTTSETVFAAASEPPDDSERGS